MCMDCYYKLNDCDEVKNKNAYRIKEEEQFMQTIGDGAEQRGEGGVSGEKVCQQGSSNRFLVEVHSILQLLEMVFCRDHSQDHQALYERDSMLVCGATPSASLYRPS